MPPLDVRGFDVPALQKDPFNAAAISEAIQQRKMWNYRLMKDQQEQEKEKLGLVRDLTDLSKYKTGSDVADALGNHLAQNVFQKWVTASKNISPTELQAGIQKDMSGIINGMNSTKDELTETDKKLATLKQIMPELDAAKLYGDLRQDVLHRRLDSTGNDFKNPMEIPPSSFNLNDPNTLSRYVNGTNNLKDMFQNPKGLDDTTVFKGTPYSFTEYKAKVAPWRTPNYDPTHLSAGFLPNNAKEPTLGFKTTMLPPDALPSSQHTPFEMMDEGVYNNLDFRQKNELMQATRSQFPNYDSFNPTEKQYAERNVLAKLAKTYDQTNFHPTERKNPSAAIIKVWNGTSGGKGSGEVTINDVYGRIKSKADEAKQKGDPYLQSNLLDAESQGLVVDYAKKLTGDNGIGQADIKLIEDDDGNIGIYHAKGSRNGQLIGQLNQSGVNLKANQSLGVKTKQAVVKEGENNTAAKKKISW